MRRQKFLYSPSYHRGVGVTTEVDCIHLRNLRLHFTLRVRDGFPYNPEDFVAVARLDGWRGPKVSMLA
jgi:hypothetical protein